MIDGCHVIIYSRDAAADRAFFKEVLGFSSVDSGGGWLIFALPPAECAFHPADVGDAHQLFLTCSDLESTLAELRARGVECEAPTEQTWGIRTSLRLPGGGRIGLYQPKHPTTRNAGRPLEH